MTSPDLSIIILNWNVRDLLRACLDSLKSSAALAIEIVVVDAASSDGSAEMVAREFPPVKLIASADNLGYSRGNNIGMAASHGRYLLILNPDTAVAGDALDALVAYADAHPEVGIVGPRLLNADGSPQASRRRYPTLATAFFESTWLQPFAPRRVLDRYYARDVPDEAAALAADWLTGACLLVRRGVYEQIGGFDEEFFMYSEELDYCRRARAAGWQIMYLPEARVYHYEGGSSEQAMPERHIRFQRSKIRYFRKYHGRLAGGVLRLFLLASYLQQLALEAAKGFVGHKRDLRRQRVSAYWRVLRSGLR